MVKKQPKNELITLIALITCILILGAFYLIFTKEYVILPYRIRSIADLEFKNYFEYYLNQKNDILNSLSNQANEIKDNIVSNINNFKNDSNKSLKNYYCIYHKCFYNELNLKKKCLNIKRYKSNRCKHLIMLNDIEIKDKGVIKIE